MVWGVDMSESTIAAKVAEKLAQDLLDARTRADAAKPGSGGNKDWSNAGWLAINAEAADLGSYMRWSFEARGLSNSEVQDLLVSFATGFRFARPIRDKRLPQTRP